MLSDMMKLVDRFVNIFKKRIYGKTFYCPVCHLELSEHDTDENGCLVCPVCSVVIELYETYGHFVPIVNDVEINRVQPKARMHPMATHLPIGLFPFALLGAGFLLLLSIYGRFAGLTAANTPFYADISPIINNVTLIMLTIAVVSSALTFLTGFLDWKYRYGGRPYRVMTLKILLSGIFLVVGLITVALHPLVFNAGIIGFDSLFNVLGAVIYFIFMGAAMFMLATLGHVGGYLVFGK
ncbi:MAG: hypothetical protein HN580_04105 [Deltaproteobacteria bacterium]|jgi:hypothetical protein|nr:hypothetical protein [Deltaproteobacteria bacterium]MBT4263050.1 hypothetical protein [Deltaproteobacteria bacterium]MBT4640542.1 hypothetical protein [Deltaproteobacteria bacterium]MBT6499166.1 hypothetical protein [Deltaproteobacteria bacterium]MBT7713983.1 hypothetical protein [Deltaproteobacteria bacterium]